MSRIYFIGTDESKTIREIGEEVERLYKDKYGRRNPNTLSKQELDQIKTEAGKRVQNRRR